MTRQFVIHGEVMVRVKFGQHVTCAYAAGGGTLPVSTISGTIGQIYNLGLAVEDVIIEINSNYQDLKASDFGPNVPPDVMWNLATANIRMTMAHYDPYVLDACLSESMAGSLAPNGTVPGQTVGANFTFGENVAGFLSPAGALLGNATPLGLSGCYYVSLNLLSPVANYPWRFKAAYLAENPLSYPLGTVRTLPKLNWRAIPYPNAGFLTPTFQNLSGGGFAGAMFMTTPYEIISSGACLWDHTLDT